MYKKLLFILALLCCAVGSRASAVSSISEISLPPALVDLVDNQLAKLPSKKLVVSDIDKIFDNEEKDSLLRLVTITDDRIIMRGVHGTTQFNNYSLVIYKLLRRLQQEQKLPNTTMLFFFNDGATKELYNYGLYKLAKDVPVFVFALDQTMPDSDRYILFPDGYTLKESDEKEVVYWHGWRQISKEIGDASVKSDWKNKKQVGFWRGRLTDCFYSEHCRNSPRLSLVSQSKHDDNIDAAFVTASILDISSREQPYKALYTYDFVSRADQVGYKYLLNLDGATCTYPGYLWRLYSNSAVLKQETSHVQWFYPLFKPYEHYIPVKKDLSDLRPQIDWAMNNDDKTHEIATNATRQVEKYLMPEMIDAYMVHLIKRYSEMVQIVE